ncbi:hypothetical protein BC629DRAFT_1291642 [Irpex lacteus]|nr:hypothetical protein BC629DRAFT_1291642 [Irpex lacteus]
MTSSTRKLTAAGLDRVAESTADTPVESSWTKLSRIIRGVDERKVKGCKEDIDTILVFAGLFSAVMTAFLVESYQSLHQDPMDTVVSLLEQIAVQTSSPTGNASAQDQRLRVNVLWFVSLVLSLVSASFGIIVQQWLREYVSTNYTSAQALLRIRHFRHPGLAKYKYSKSPHHTIVPPTITRALPRWPLLLYCRGPLNHRPYNSSSGCGVGVSVPCHQLGSYMGSGVSI